MNQPDWLTAAEAAELLGITSATLYSYVSRGLLRSERAPDGSRARLYPRDDVQALKLRQMQRRHPRQMLETSLHWGAPLLETSLSIVRDGRLYYRGRDVVELAAHATLEEVASLLWDGPCPSSGIDAAPTIDPAGLPLSAAFTVGLALGGAADPGAHDLRPAAVRRRGARILRLFADIVSGGVGEGDVASRLHRAWCPNRPRPLALLRAALVLCAEHELNVSAFTARCAASAGATPYAVVTAALAACTGTLHGAATERVDALYDEARRTDASSALEARLRRGEAIAGFGHALYPNGDPRATLLLAMLREQFPRSPAMRLTDRLEQAARALVGDPPTIDLALVALSRTLELPPGSPFVIFAVARTVGWIAHAIEQYGTDRLIRPRARYTGPEPVPLL